MSTRHTQTVLNVIKRINTNHIRVPLMNPLSVSAHSKITVFSEETEKPDKSVCEIDIIVRFMAGTPFVFFLDIILAWIRGGVNKP